MVAKSQTHRGDLLLLFYALVFFGPEACEILAPQPGVETSLPALECEVLTPGPPGSPLNSVFGQLFILFHELYIQGSSLVLSNEV